MNQDTTTQMASDQEVLTANLIPLGTRNEEVQQVWSASPEGDEDGAALVGAGKNSGEAGSITEDGIVRHPGFVMRQETETQMASDQEGPTANLGLLGTRNEETEQVFSTPPEGDDEHDETATPTPQPVNSQERHAANLQMLGITDEAIARASSGSPHRTTGNSAHRSNHINAIRQIAPQVIAEHDGAVMFCAETILKYLVKAGHGKTARGEVIRGANAIGDSLGRHGLHLPSLTKDGKRRYAVSMVDASDEEKASLQESLHTMSKKELNALRFA